MQSSAYKALLAKQEAEDKERQDKLEELRRKKLREEIIKKREEEDARKRAAAAKQQREKDAQEAKIAEQKREELQRQQAEEKARKRPLTIDEARERRAKADAIRNSAGIAKDRQAIQPARKSYSSLLASAPTKLEAITPVRANIARTSPTKQVGKFSSPSATDRPSVANKGSSSTSSSRTNVVKHSLASPHRPVAPSSKLSKAGQRKLPADAPPLVPLQKQKRDLRTIEEIQKDLHRQKGKNYAYLHSNTATSKSSTSPVKTLAQSSAQSSVHKVASKERQDRGNVSTKDQITKRTRRPSYSSDDSVVSRSNADSRHGSRHDDGLGGESIWDILNPGKKRSTYLARDIDSDDSDMEANAADIRREEQRAARAAKLEDEREERALREQEARKALKKRRL